MHKTEVDNIHALHRRWTKYRDADAKAELDAIANGEGHAFITAALATYQEFPDWDDQDTRIRENLTEYYNNPDAFDAAELWEMFEDRDPAEFL